MNLDPQLKERIFSAIDASKILSVPAAGALASTLRELHLDSLDLVSLSMLMEEEFELTIELEDASEGSTFGDLLDALRPYTG
jgi:acyl carrier protein